MKANFPYPFYKSLRFRFGLLFGFLFLLFLLAVVFFLYGNIKTALEKSFESRLESGANTVLLKTEISPVIIPLPQNNEYFLLTYNSIKKTDTLFNNLPVQLSPDALLHHANKGDWRFTTSSLTLETGGIIFILYVLPAGELNASVRQLQRLLFIYIPLAFMVSLTAGYFLSGFLLRPVNNIIAKANNINLQADIKLLDEPDTQDELHELAVAVNRMLQRIRKQSEQQNAFFASASHELRTPLSTMLTELQVLQARHPASSLQPVFENQLTAVQRLSKLVNDFLLMSQLKSGNVVMHAQTIYAADMVIDCIKQLKEKAQAQSQTFKINLLPSGSEFAVSADKDHLASMVFNLLDNAVKYGLPSSVIQLQLEQTGQAVFIRIANHTGYAVTNVHELTGEFYRQGFYKEGFGLGLWIVDQLAKNNNGSLSLSFHAPVFTAVLQFAI